MTGSARYVINMANSIIGVSILSMPYCFKETGLMLGIILLLLCGFVTKKTCMFLIKSAIMSRRRCYELLAFQVFGVSGKLLMELCMILFLMGICISFHVVVGDLAPAMVAKYLAVENTSSLRCTLLVGMVLLIILPLCLLRNLDSLASMSACSIGFYVFLNGVIFAAAFSRLLDGSWIESAEMFNFQNVFRVLPIMMLALACQSNVFEIYYSIPEPSVEKMKTVVSQAVNLSCALYIGVGFLGYVTFIDRDIGGNVILNFPNSNMTDGITIIFVITLAISFPLILFPCRTSIHSLLYRRNIAQGSYDIAVNFIPESRFKVITFSVLFISMLIGILLPSIEFVLGLLGSTMGMLIALIFPSIFFIKVYTKQSFDRLLAQGLLILGVILMVTGTYVHLSGLQSSQDYVSTGSISSNQVSDNIGRLSPEITAIIQESIPKDLDSGDVTGRREPAIPEPPIQNEKLPSEQEVVIPVLNDMASKEFKKSKYPDNSKSDKIKDSNDSISLGQLNFKTSPNNTVYNQPNFKSAPNNTFNHPQYKLAPNNSINSLPQYKKFLNNTINQPQVKTFPNNTINQQHLKAIRNEVSQLHIKTAPNNTININQPLFKTAPNNNIASNKVGGTDKLLKETSILLNSFSDFKESKGSEIRKVSQKIDLKNKKEDNLHPDAIEKELKENELEVLKEKLQIPNEIEYKQEKILQQMEVQQFQQKQLIEEQKKILQELKDQKEKINEMGIEKHVLLTAGLDLLSQHSPDHKVVPLINKGTFAQQKVSSIILANDDLSEKQENKEKEIISKAKDREEKFVPPKTNMLKPLVLQNRMKAIGKKAVDDINVAPLIPVSDKPDETLSHDEERRKRDLVSVNSKASDLVKPVQFPNPKIAVNLDLPNAPVTDKTNIVLQYNSPMLVESVELNQAVVAFDDHQKTSYKNEDIPKDGANASLLNLVNSDKLSLDIPLSKLPNSASNNIQQTDFEIQIKKDLKKAEVDNVVYDTRHLLWSSRANAKVNLGRRRKRKNKQYPDYMDEM